jgi:hypothetical protein
MVMIVQTMMQTMGDGDGDGDICENLNLYVPHVHPCASMCTHVWTMNGLKFNWEWIKNQLKMN